MRRPRTGHACPRTGFAVRRLLPLAAVLVVLVASCSLVDLRGERPETTRFRIDYESPGLEPAAHEAGSSVRMRDFAAARDYAGDGMVLVSDSGLSVEMSSHRWSQPPQCLLPDLLARDLAASGLVEGVSRHVPGDTDFTVDGFLRLFGGVESEGRWYAVIEVDAVFRADPGCRPEGLKTAWHIYRVQEPVDGEGFDLLADAMTRAARELSKTLLEDLLEWTSGRCR